MTRLPAALLCTVALAMALPPASPAPAAHPTDVPSLLAWLVAQGHLAPEEASHLAPVPVLEVPAVPLAVLAPLPPVGCSGLYGDVGALVDPHATMPACGLVATFHNRPIWLATLTSVAIGSGFAIAFSLMDGIDQDGRSGVLLLTCPPTGTILDFEQQNLVVATPGCAAFRAGTDPSTWIGWDGFGGAFSGLGVWDATVLLRL